MNTVSYYQSPVGWFKLTADETSLCSLELNAQPDEQVVHQIISHPVLLNTHIQLSEYFSGQRKTFDIPLSFHGTDFQMQCWRSLIAIPYGETRSYKDIAIEIENSKAVRAVGMANNRNKIAIIIPCHRVIGANGKLVGFGGGLSMKEWLLNHEHSNSTS